MMRRETQGVHLSFDGDLLQSVKISRGHEVRPLWSRMEKLIPDHMILWADRFDSLCAISCEWAIAQALEISAGVEVTKRTQFVRTILCEINRLVWLTTYMSRITSALAQRSLTQQVLVLREQVFVMQEELTGGRILPQAFSLAGCRRELAVGDVQKVRQFTQGWKYSWEKWLSLVLGDPLLESRLKGLLIIDQSFIKLWAWWGIVGKSAGVNYDSRRHRPHGAYPYVDFNLIHKKSSDAFARFEVAVEEVNLSLNIIDQLLKTIPHQIDQKQKWEKLNPGFYFGSAESAKGPIISAIEVGNDNVVSAVRLFSTGQRVWPLIEGMFKGIRAEDFQLALMSLGIDAEDAEI